MRLKLGILLAIPLEFALETSQKRAIRNYRARLGRRGLARFEVLGRDADRDLIRSLARQLAEGGPEASRLRAELGHDFALVTPGVRPAGSGHGDQVRVVTPAEAVAAGASHIVVGRPITEATDPAAEARAILAQIGSWKNSPQTGETV